LGIFLWLSGLVLWLAINQPGVGSVESNYMWLCLGILICINKFNSLVVSRETVLEELTYRDK